MFNVCHPSQHCVPPLDVFVGPSSSSCHSEALNPSKYFDPKPDKSPVEFCVVKSDPSLGPKICGAFFRIHSRSKTPGSNEARQLLGGIFCTTT
ncbi:hypothetical protein K438DRAFT_1871681 [Mycena galopus ATCC 62051]|nr:hypothetical protein K438DRAFT_1871681 [Mycena galopus ATCC 62051]